MDLHKFLTLVTTLVLCLSIGPTEAASEELISFPFDSKPCTCASLKCTCCQGVVVNPIKLSKKLCLSYKLVVIPLTVDFAILLDNSTIIELSINPLAPPTYCIPIPLPNTVGMCVKFHDIKLLSILAPQAVKVCTTFYVNYETKQIYDYAFPCLKLSTTGMSLMSK